MRLDYSGVTNQGLGPARRKKWSMMETRLDMLAYVPSAIRDFEGIDGGMGIQSVDVSSWKDFSSQGAHV
jgi:hypothetical protein